MMHASLRPWIQSRTSIGAIALLLLLLALGSGAAAPGLADRRPPTAPKSLRVTAFAHYSVSLAWNPSTDDSGFFTYWIQCSNGYSMPVPMSSTSATFTDGLNAGVTYSFYVYAVDGSGNRSKNSNKVTVSLPRDINPPTVPVLTATDVGPTHVSLSWSSTDEGSTIYYTVYRDGVKFFSDTAATGGVMNGLQPGSTYSFTANARDRLRNGSATSAPLVVTTGAVDPNDTTPPTAPTNLSVFHYPGDLEMNLDWSESTDNVDPQDAIRYEVYVNGELADIVFGVGRSISYGVFGENVVTVFAVDAAGNVSEPATFITDI